MDGRRLSFVGAELPPGFESRTVTLAPGRSRRYDAAEWRDALVTVELGEVELEGADGARRRFARGDSLWLAELALRALHNRGGEPAVLSAVSRQPQA